MLGVSVMRTKRQTGPKLGELLAARGKLDRDALLQALRLQRTSGGRLGTCLLELDAVSEDDLLHVLSEQLGVPFIDSEELRAIPEDVIRLVPEKVARRRLAVPVRGSGTQLSVVLLDPHDLAALDELAFVSGRRIRPHAATEARIQEALARYYHLDVPTRFIKLVDRMNRSRYMWGSTETQQAEPEPPSYSSRPAPHISVYGSPEPPPPISAPAIAPAVVVASPPPVAATAMAPPPVDSPRTPPAPALPSFPTAVAVPAPAPVAAEPIGESAPEPPALDFGTASQRLAEPADREEIAWALLGFARGLARPALLVVLRKDEAVGWSGRGLAPSAVDELRVPLSQPSVLHALRDGAPLHRGPLSDLQGNQQLHGFFPGAEDLLVLPLRVRDRVVAALFVRVDDPPADARSIDELRQLAEHASAALAWLIVRQKQRNG